MRTAILAPGLHVFSGGLQQRVGWEEFADSVLRALPSGTFYRRSGIVGEIRNGDFARISTGQARLIVDGLVEIESHSVKQKAEHVQYIPCTADMAAAVVDRAGCLHADGQGHEIETEGGLLPMKGTIRLLHAVTPHPVVASGGRILEGGWHPGFGVLVLPSVLPAEPIDPRGLIADFGLDPISEAHVLAMMLTVLARPVLKGNVPLFVVTAPVAGAGKTMLVDEVVGSVTLGRAVPSMIWPDDHDEIRKTLTAAMMSGSPLLNLDNVPRVLDSEALASFLTTSSWRDRILGQSQSVELPNTITLAATGNQVQASGELSRRSVTISLQPGCDSPEMRRGLNGHKWRYQNLRAEALAQRDGIIAWFLRLCSTWNEAGRPESGLVFGSFSEWVRVVVDPLVHAGFPVLKDIHESSVRLDVDRMDLDAVVARWWELHADIGIYPKDVLQIADQVGAWQALIASRSGERSQVTVVGLKLTRLVGRIVNGYRVDQQQSRSGRVYRLIREAR